MDIRLVYSKEANDSHSTTDYLSRNSIRKVAMLVWRNGQLFASVANSAASSSNGVFLNAINSNDSSVLALIEQLNSTIYN